MKFKNVPNSEMFSRYVQKLKIMFALKKKNTETLLSLQNMFLFLKIVHNL